MLLTDISWTDYVAGRARIIVMLLTDAKSECVAGHARITVTD